MKGRGPNEGIGNNDLVKDDSDDLILGDPKKPHEESITHRELEDTIARLDRVINGTIGNTGIEEPGNSKESSERTPREEILEILKELSNRNSNERMESIGSLLEQGLNAILPHLLEILEESITTYETSGETKEDATTPETNLIKEIINILKHITRRYKSLRGIKLSPDHDAIRKSYLDFPKLLQDSVGEDRLCNGLDIIIQALSVNVRIVRADITQSILPEVVDTFCERLIPIKNDPTFGEHITKALAVATKNFRIREREGKITPEEKVALKLIERFISEEE